MRIARLAFVSFRHSLFTQSCVCHRVCIASETTLSVLHIRTKGLVTGKAGSSPTSAPRHSTDNPGQTAMQPERQNKRDALAVGTPLGSACGKLQLPSQQTGSACAYVCLRPTRPATQARCPFSATIRACLPSFRTDLQSFSQIENWKTQKRKRGGLGYDTPPLRLCERPEASSQLNPLYGTR